MSHPLPTDFTAGHFNAAAVADLPLIPNPLIFSAMAFPVLCRPKNAFAEQAVAFRLQRAVIDGFRLFHFAV